MFTSPFLTVYVCIFLSNWWKSCLVKRWWNWPLKVDFTNILRAAFAPISLRQKNTNLSRKYRKAAQKTFVRKSCLVKCWWNWLLKVDGKTVFSTEIHPRSGIQSLYDEEGKQILRLVPESLTVCLIIIFLSFEYSFMYSNIGLKKLLH